MNDGKCKAQAKKGTKIVTGSSSAMKAGKSTGKYGKGGGSSKK
jgi:hypothetical protein